MSVFAKRRILQLVLIGLLGGAQAAPVFPVKYSSNNRYLVDQTDAPFPILGRTAWFVTSLSVADYQTFVDDTAARGYNAIELHVINHDPRGNNPPFGGNGSLPFLNRLDGAPWSGSLDNPDINNQAPDFTTPNEAYWNHVDGFLAYCESKGMLVFMFPAYVGFQGGEQGWMQELVANGETRTQSYGAWIATRYQNQKNLVWMMGGDFGTPPYAFNAAQTSVENALLTGLKSVAGQQSTLFSAEWTFESIATDQPAFGSSMTLNGAYSYSGYVNYEGRRAYAYNPIEPAFLLEEPFDEEGPDGKGINESATQPIRRFQWWGWLSTIAGYISGNGYVWPFRSDNAVVDWRNHLDTQGSRDMARLNAFINSVAWYKLVPSDLGGMRLLITAGNSHVTLDDHVAAAATPDRTLLVAYLPPAHNGPISVDMEALGGPARARWFDPTSGSYSDIGSGLPNTGSRSFTTPGNNSAGAKDWVLVLDYSPTGAPTIGNIPDQATRVNTPIVAIPFTIDDIDTPIGNLTLSAESSNEALVPANNVVFEGGGMNRTVTVSPVASQVGTATITISVSDGTTMTSDTFVLTVTYPLSVVADDAIRAQGQSNPIFTGTITGVQNGDNITASYASPATIDSLPGEYEIVPTLIDPDSRLVNYTVAITNGILTIVEGPRLMSISESSPGTFIVECQVQAGRTYQFQFKNSLLDNVWTPLGADQTAVSSRVAITNDANAGSQRFYRLLDVTTP